MYEVFIEEQVIPCLTFEEADRLHNELDDLGLMKINVTESDDLWVGKQSYAGLTEDEAERLYGALEDFGLTGLLMDEWRRSLPKTFPVLAETI